VRVGSLDRRGDPGYVYKCATDDRASTRRRRTKTIRWIVGKRLNTAAVFVAAVDLLFLVVERRV